jgi:hypothetical protein
MKTVLALAAVAVFAPSLAAAADLTGTWKIKTKGGDGADIVVNCKLAQAGSALTGACGLDGAPDAPAPLTGSVDGATVKWAYDVDFQGMKLHIAFTANATDAAMTGNMDLAGMATPFTAAKQ